MSRPAERDLPPDRHRLLKEHVMAEIRHAEDTSRIRRAWRRPVLAAVAVATVAALTLVVLPSGGAEGVRRPGAAVTPETDELRGARDDQYTYVDMLVSWSSTEIAEDGGSTTTLRPLHRLEQWEAVDGTRKGLIIEQGGEGKRVTQPDRPPGEEAELLSTNYRRLSSLPTDTDAMYAWLRSTAAVAVKGGDPDPGQVMWLVAGDMFGSGMLPPKQSAALYRAVARIPSVTAVKSSVDAAGRRGVALTHRQTGSPVREEWVFDPTSHRFLGTRSVYVEDEGGIRKGTVGSTTAILSRAVVDKAGQRP
ncbi:CU044_5270 family protein [Streptomyces phaeofaciens]|uniref:CU044_5270 family protein n=1 Tax=Streptomyces phaeofaciens TaxID=68254 RepID=UPI0036818F07